MKYFPALLSLYVFFFHVLDLVAAAGYLPFYNNGYEIRDLMKTDTCFTGYALLWTSDPVIPPTKNPYIYCSDGYYILGGLGILGPSSGSQANSYFARSYNGLRTHNVIFYTLTYYTQHTWDTNDFIQIKFGASPEISLGISVAQTRYYEDVYCPGGGVVLRNIRVFGSIQNSETNLLIKVISQANEVNTNEAFGIREFTTFYVQSGSPPADTVCTTGPDGLTTSIQCFCGEGYYNLGGVCTPCASTCASCYGGGADQCYECKPGSSLILDTCVACYEGCNFCIGPAYNQCLECARDFFLLNGNQCVSKCDPPLVQSTTAYGCVNTCSTPCTVTTDFVYWDGACNATCPQPLVTSNLYGAIKYCRWPCADGQFLLWNGVCVSSCPSPFIPQAENGQQFCTTPCNTGEFIYWDSSCNNTCDFPLRQDNYNGQLLCEYYCPPTQFMLWNGSCSTCPDPLIQRFWKGYQFCVFPLEDTSLYLYWDGVGEKTCDFPLWPGTQGAPMVRYFCYYHCLLTKYLYVNGTCGDFCHFPLSTRIRDGRMFCDNPCDPVTEFLYWNGSCIDNCNLPYLQRIEPGTRYCDFACNYDHYLYWDNTCLPTCTMPLKNYTAALEPMQYCNYSCATSEFLYWNSTCSDSCNFPLVQQTYKARQFCDYPCISRSQYLYYNGTCSDNCLFPYVNHRENGYGFCNYPCLSDEYLFWDGRCLSHCNSPLIYQPGSYGEKFCFTPCMNPLEYYILETGQCVESCDEDSKVQNDLYLRCLLPPVVDDNGLIQLLLVIQGYSGTTSLLAPVKLSEHIRYLDVNQPPRLRRFSLSQARAILTPKFGIPKPSDLGSWFVKVNIPDVYDGQNLHSSFFINYWDAMTTIMSVFFIGVMIAAISYMMKGEDNIENHTIMEKVKTVFVWNFCLVLFVLNIDEALLYIAIDFRSAKLSRGSATFSIFMCLLMILLVIIFILITHYILKKRHRIKKTALASEEFEGLAQFMKKWEGWQVVFRGYRDNTYFNRYFYLLYMTRVAFPMFASSLFVRMPVTQTSVHMVTSIFIVAYIILANPLKRTINYVQLLTLETLILVVNISAFLMAVFDRVTYINDRAYVLLGDIIIVSNFCYNVVVIAFLPIKLGLEFYYIYKFEMSQEKRNPSNWVRLLVIPVQQCAFGFEEVLPQTYNPGEDNEPDYEEKIVTQRISDFKGVRPKKLRNKRNNTTPATRSPSLDGIHLDRVVGEIGEDDARFRAYRARNTQPAIVEEDETESVSGINYGNYGRSPHGLNLNRSMLDNSMYPINHDHPVDLSFDHQITPANQTIVSPLDLSKAFFLKENDDQMAQDSVVLRGFDTNGEEFASPRINPQGYDFQARRHGAVQGSVMVSHGMNTPTEKKRKTGPHTSRIISKRNSLGVSVSSLAQDLPDNRFNHNNHGIDRIVDDL